MIVFTQASKLTNYLQKLKSVNNTVGFVPTMGALHAGHISLINAAQAQHQVTVCSIFVNPTQFNNASDLEAYPRTIEADIKLLLNSGCDVLFYPNTAEMYATGLENNTEDYGSITHVFEGAYRPGHFNGVITIVRKLFELVKPDKAYFGQKDYQQCLVVRELVKRNGFDTKIEICPIVREPDGLAMSSRNVRLNENERKAATAISKALFEIAAPSSQKTIAELKQLAENRIKQESLLKLEYVEIVNAENLEPVDESNITQPKIALLAAFCGKTRLIDNVILNQ